MEFPRGPTAARGGSAMQRTGISSVFLQRSAILIGVSMVLLLFAASAPGAGPKEKTLYQFQGGGDGWYPLAPMISDKNGNLYGTTAQGGTSGECEGQGVVGCGTIFELKAPARAGGVWTEAVIYTFQGG